jgi:hypothetical protein
MRNSRVVPVVLILIIIAIAIAALVSLARAVFSGGSQTTSQVDISTKSLLTTTADRSVMMTVRGPIVGDENFYSYTIAISPASRTLTMYNGYLDTPINQVILDNSTPAYEQFVYALNKANLVKGAELTGDANDTRGVCAVGDLYEFAVFKSNKSVEMLWASNCSAEKGSLNADYYAVKSLFMSQIPKSQSLIDTIKI